MITAIGGGRSSKVGDQEGWSGAVPLVGSGAKPSVWVWGEAPTEADDTCENMIF